MNQSAQQQAPDPFATDTADPARVFRQMFPLPPPAGLAPGWRLFESRMDISTVLFPRARLAAARDAARMALLQRPPAPPATQNERTP